MAVATQIRGGTHVDIGSDHGHLLKALLATGRIEKGIAIENKTIPYEVSLQALHGFSADVRLADGFEGLTPDDHADSVSLCGMGGNRIASILGQYPDRVPNQVWTQPNSSPESVRRWARPAGFHLIDERLVPGHSSRRVFWVMRFQRQDLGSDDDPAYHGVEPREAGELFGPLLIRDRDPRLLRLLRQELYRLGKPGRLEPTSQSRLEIVRQVLDQFSPEGDNGR